MFKNKVTKTIGYFLVLVFLFGLSVDIQAQKKPNDKAKKAAALGDNLFGRKDYRGAVSKYAEALVISPDYGYAHFWKGYAHFYLDEYDLSIAELNTAFDQGFQPLQIYKLRWFVNFNLKNYDAALSDVQKGIILEPNNPTFSLGVADIYHAKGEYQKSIDAYKKALLIDPKNGDAYYYMAVDYENLGDSPKQLESALGAIKYNTKFVGEAFALVGDVHLKDGKKDEAIKAYQRALNVKPEMADVYVKLSNVYYSQDRLKDAIDIAGKGVKLFPENGYLYTNLSIYYSVQNRNFEAINNAVKAIRLLPDKPEAFTVLCRAYNDTAQYADSIKYCTDALNIIPNDGEMNFYLARAYSLTNKNNEEKAAPYYKKAVESLTKFTDDNPKDANGFYLLANAYLADSQPNKAIDAFKKSIELNAGLAKAYYNLGYTYFLTQDMTSARAQYDALLKIDAKLAEKLKQVIDKK